MNTFIRMTEIFEVVEIKENDVEFNTLKVMDIEERKPSKKIFNDKVNEVELNDLIENLDELFRRR